MYSNLQLKYNYFYKQYIKRLIDNPEDMISYICEHNTYRREDYIMANLSIAKIGQRIFNATKHEQTVARNSNPFAASSFKVNALTTADVFQSEKPSMAEKVSSKSKLMYSALVGSISDIGNRINHGIESVKAFCNRAIDGFVGFWNKMNDIEVSVDIANTGKSIKSSWNALQDERAVQRYMAMPAGKTEGKESLESMLISELGLNVAA